jgi:hypothetical protein
MSTPSQTPNTFRSTWDELGLLTKPGRAFFLENSSEIRDARVVGPFCLQIAICDAWKSLEFEGLQVVDGFAQVVKTSNIARGRRERL